MGKFQFILFLTLLPILFSACEKELAEINNDPTRKTDIDIQFLLPDVLLSSTYNVAGDPTRTAGILMQQFDGLSVQQVEFENYALGDNAMVQFWFNGLYTGVLRSCQVIIDKTFELENEQNRSYSFYRGLARLIQANEYGLAASYFGDIPFSEALQGTGNLKPAYDPQEQVYAGVQQLLDEAITDLSDPKGYLGGDLIFDGDAVAWIRVANAMKIRFYMHLTKRDPAVSQKVLALLPGAIINLSQQPTVTFASDSKAPLASFSVSWGPTLGFNPGFAGMLESDPRKNFYVEEQGENFLFYNTSNSNLVWAQDDATLPIISFVEMKFIEAEALLRTGAADAVIEEALREAIAASMEQVGAGDYDRYLDNNTNMEGLTFDEKLERIIVEAYKAYYGYAFSETWSNYRRTGYPVLTPSPLGVNGFNPSGVIPRRYLYVSNEVLNNSAAVQAARERQNGALLDVDVWAFAD